MKRLIICCDGTWNEPESYQDDRKIPTNVLKMVRAVCPRSNGAGRPVEQVVFYDQGVGTGGFGLLDKHVGGGTGYGISENILDSYYFLANNYAEGDEIFLFGFSRGAYTVRSLSGMLSAVGLLDKNDLRYAPEAYAYYHTPPNERLTSRFAFIKDRPRVVPPIRFLGVWDTVGALGIPTPILREAQNWLGRYFPGIRVGFHDTELSPQVTHAYHALAIDERRGPFQPSLWTKKLPDQVVEQAWFAGVHSNIGGGYRDVGLSDVAFSWMIDRARRCGLEISNSYITNHVEAQPLGKLEDSYSVGYRVMEKLNVPAYERPIGKHLQIGEMIHDSVLTRIEGDPKYRPSNLGLVAPLQTFERAGTTYATIQGVDIPVATTPPLVDRRQTPRALTPNTPAAVRLSGERRVAGSLVDLAAGAGARVILSESLSVGQTVEVDSSLTPAQRAVVVWSTNRQAGLRFAA